MSWLECDPRHTTFAAGWRERGAGRYGKKAGATVIKQFWISLYVRGSDGQPLDGGQQPLSFLQRPHDTHTVKRFNGWTCSLSSLHHQFSHSHRAPGECSCECEASAYSSLACADRGSESIKSRMKPSLCSDHQTCKISSSITSREFPLRPLLDQ